MSSPIIQDIFGGFEYGITSGFGPRISPGGIGSKNHKGLDLGAPLGTPIYSPVSGSVDFAGVKGGYGNRVEIESDDYTYGFAHLDSIGVTRNSTVNKGDLIGYSGSTGNSTGPHLHFDVRDASGSFIDPETAPAGDSGGSIWRNLWGSNDNLISGWTGRELTDEQSSLARKAIGGPIGIVGDMLGEFGGRIVVILIGLLLLGAALWMLAASGSKQAIVIRDSIKERFSFT